MDYRPLSSENHEIRLLTLLEGKNSAMVSCRLEHYSLIDHPSYAALSYCWGNPDCTKTVIVNDVRVQVTVNLEAGLRQLQSEGYTTMWVDALCINQADREERSLQVLSMRTIYSQATTVVAWLGIETDNSSLAMDFINDFMWEDKKKSWNLESDMVLRSAFKKLFERVYWKRVWIIQEIVAATVVRFFCGPRSTYWGCIQKVLKDIPEGRHLLAAGYVPDFKFFRKSTTNGTQKPLIRLLLASRASLATDPRDKVYALLGLASDGHELVPVPNYRQPVGSVFEELTRAMLVSQSCADIIVFRRATRGPADNLPSWVPDLGDLGEMAMPWRGGNLLAETSAWQYGHFLPEMMSLLDPLMRKALKVGKFDLTGKPSISAGKEGVSNHQMIKMQGRIIGTVNGISTQISGDDRPQSSQEARRRKMTQPSTKECAYKTDKEMMVAVANCLSMHGLDLGFNDKRELVWNGAMIETLRAMSSKSGQRIMKESHPLLLEWLESNRHFKIDGLSLHRWMTLPVPSGIGGGLYVAWDLVTESVGNRDKELIPFIDRVAQVIGNGMRLIVTDGGQIGVVHAQARPTDEICILRGCSVPVVLREADGFGWNIVGAAYLHPLPTIERFVEIGWDDFWIT